MSESETRRLKVAYILTPITFGGAEKVSLNFLRAVDRSKFDIHPILLVRPWEEETYLGRELRNHGYAYDAIPVAKGREADYWRIPRVIQRIYGLLKRSSFDFVHTHGYFADICGLPVARIMGIAGIATCHGYISNDRKLRFYNALDKLALRTCKRIIAVSEGIRDELVKSGIQPSRVVVLQNAVAPPFGAETLDDHRSAARQRLSIGPAEFVIGFVGRLSDEKGLNYLVEAVAALQEKGCACKLIIVGEGPARQELELLVRARGVEKMTTFAGFQPDVAAWLPVFDVLTLPSLTEGTPMALLEAMAAGVPVIATAVGGVPQVVADGVNGLLVPPGNVQALSDKLRSLRDNAELKNRLGRAGLETISAKYNLYNWCRAVESQYRCADLHRNLVKGHSSC